MPATNMSIACQFQRCSYRCTLITTIATDLWPPLTNSFIVIQSSIIKHGWDFSSFCCNCTICIYKSECLFQNLFILKMASQFCCCNFTTCIYKSKCLFQNLFILKHRYAVVCNDSELLLQSISCTSVVSIAFTGMLSTLHRLECRRTLSFNNIVASDKCISQQMCYI